MSGVVLSVLLICLLCIGLLYLARRDGVIAAAVRVIAGLTLICLVLGTAIYWVAERASHPAAAATQDEAPSDVASMSWEEAEAASVQQLNSEALELLEGTLALASQSPAAVCASLPEMEDKIWQAEDVVANLEGIDLTAEDAATLVTLRSSVRDVRAAYDKAVPACAQAFG